jgi:hypothetical protein
VPVVWCYRLDPVSVDVQKHHAGPSPPTPGSGRSIGARYGRWAGRGYRCRQPGPLRLPQGAYLPTVGAGVCADTAAPKIIAESTGLGHEAVKKTCQRMAEDGQLIPDTAGRYTAPHPGGTPTYPTSPMSPVSPKRPDLHKCPRPRGHLPALMSPDPAQHRQGAALTTRANPSPHLLTIEAAAERIAMSPATSGA